MERPHVVAGRCRRRLPRWITACLAAIAATLSEPAAATVVVVATGTSAGGRAVVFSASLTLEDDDLILTLANVSSLTSRSADDVLSSFYFDVARGGLRPPLSLVEASGYVVRVRSGLPDVPESYTPQTYVSGSGRLSDLVARDPGDASWLGRAMTPQESPFLGFGVGTVGNSRLSPNIFNPHVVGPPGRHMIDFAIATVGDLEPIGVLDGAHLVAGDAWFRFTGATGYAESDIVDLYAFGLGTGPDSVMIISMPEPAGFALVALGVLLVAGWRLWVSGGVGQT